MSLALSLAVQYIVRPEKVPSRYDFRRWIKAALIHDYLAAEITLRIVDQEEGCLLNHTYRQKKYATNVLTFSFEEEMADLENATLRGDVVLCAPVIEQEAYAQNKALFAHYAHLVIHGILHLQGYDHLVKSDAKVMEALEIEVLQQQGYGDPYFSL